MNRAVSLLKRELSSSYIDLEWAIKHNDKEIENDRRESILEIENAIKILTKTNHDADNKALNLQRVSNALCKKCGKSPIAEGANSLCDRCLTVAYYSK